MYRTVRRVRLLSALEDAISYAQWGLSEILKVDPDDDARNLLETER